MNAPQHSSMIGQHVGKYRISAEMGQRGLGTVYEVVQDSIGHRAVVKILPGQLAADPRHEKYVSRFLDEARAVNLLDSPGVVKIFDFGERPDKSVYILMEFLDGDVLLERLARLHGSGGRIGAAAALRIIRQLAAVLMVAHSKGLIHRDIKPDNIILVPDGEAPGKERVKILDFCLAKFLDTPERRTTAGTTLGSPTYMSPEQCLGADQIDGETDVYSLGVLLYEMLAGRPPFEGEMRTMLNAQVNQLPTPIQQLSPGLPEPAAQLVHEMLAKKAEQRPKMAQIEARIAEMEAKGVLAEGARQAIAASQKVGGPLVRLLPAGPAALGLVLGLGIGRLLFASPVLPAPICPEVAAAPVEKAARLDPAPSVVEEPRAAAAKAEPPKGKKIKKGR